MPKKKIEEVLNTCPVCGKLFKYNPAAHSYIVKGGYTCSWDCFTRRIKEREKEEKNGKQNK